jgi:hypothetical protein
LTYLNIPFFHDGRLRRLHHPDGRIIYELGYPSQVTAAFPVEEPYLDYRSPARE